MSADNVSTILVLDDEPTVREVVVSQLGRDGHRTREAADGLTALGRRRGACSASDAATAGTAPRMEFRETIELVGKTVDAAGVVAIVVGILFGTAAFARALAARRDTQDAYRRYRQRIGRGILLGLEILVAADIIRTVAVAPTIEGVAVLGGIVLIRTFLSFTLELELSGRWPWQSHGRDEGVAPSAPV
jgi:uncharacterized membrane protein